MTGASMLHGEGTIIVESLFDGTNWTDITSDVYYASKLNFSFGRQDETSESQPAQLTFSLLNSTGNYTPYSPSSTHFPGVRRNCPIRTRFVSGGLFEEGFESGVAGWTPFSATFVQDATHVHSGSNAAKMVVTGTPGSAGSRNVAFAATVGRSYTFSMWAFATGSTTNVQATIGWQDASHSSITDSTTTVTLAANTWTQITVTATAPALTAFATFGPTLTSSPATGKTIWVDDIAFGVTSVQLFYGYAVGFTPTWDTSANLALVQVVAAGSLRRLTQGSAPLQSALFRAITKQTSFNYDGYWSMEDAAGSSQFAAGPSQGFPLSPIQISGITRGTLASSTAVPGSMALPDFSNAQHVTAPVTQVNTGNAGFTVDHVLFVGDTPSGSGLVPLTRIFILNGSWQISLDLSAQEWQVDLFDTSGSSLGSFSASWASTMSPFDGQPHLVRFTTNNNGFNTDGVLRVDDAGVINASGTLTFGGNATKIGVAGALTTFPLVIGHLLVVNDEPIGDNTPAMLGNAGETASTRVSRLCTEQDVAIDVTGSSHIAMGAQTTAAFVDILREAETAENGFLYDGFDTGLGYIAGPARYNLTAAMTLDMSAGQVAPPFAPVDDDQRTVNEVTASRTGGSTATITQTDGDLGTDSVGVYDSSVDVNVDTDGILDDIAGWQVHLGTIAGLRYPTMTLDLVAVPALIPIFLATEGVGFRVDVTNVTSKATQHPPGTVSLIVEGYSMALDLQSWIITANCAPYVPWQVAVYGTDRYDSASSTVNTNITSSGTSLSVAFAQTIDKWGTSTPFTIKIDSEVMTVTAVSGSTSPQTLTVTRGTSGIQAAHTAGAEVHVYPLPIYAL